MQPQTNEIRDFYLAFGKLFLLYVTLGHRIKNLKVEEKYFKKITAKNLLNLFSQWRHSCIVNLWRELTGK